MKKFILALLLTISTTAQAKWWHLGGNVQVNNQQVSFSAYNSTGRAVLCKGYVYGRSNFGEVGNFKIQGWVQPGGHVYGYVNAWGNRYLVDGWAEVYCRF